MHNDAIAGKPEPKRFLPIDQVRAKVGGVSVSWVYMKIKAGEFPKQIKLSEKHSVWLESEIDRWIDERTEAGRP